MTKPKPKEDDTPDGERELAAVADGVSVALEDAKTHSQRVSMTDAQHAAFVEAMTKAVADNLADFGRRLDRIERITGIGSEHATNDAHHRE